MADFDPAFALIVGEEGALSLDHDDPGNWTGGKVGAGELRGTKFGISAAAFPTIDIRNLSLPDARAIYRAKYWDRNRCGDMPWNWALGIFDGEVNQGVGLELAQKTLGLKADGLAGPATLAAIARATPLQFGLFMAARIVRYSQSHLWAQDGLGWSRRALEIHHHALTP
jgi:lysozyme family protein